MPMVLADAAKPRKAQQEKPQRDPDEPRVAQVRRGLPKDEGFVATEALADIAQNLNFKHRKSKGLVRMPQMLCAPTLPGLRVGGFRYNLGGFAKRNS